jgi:acetyltransferase-like isoleucine patch superfamily enzyme
LKSQWDHAFASGATFKVPKFHHLPVIDQLWCLAEKFYSAYRMRALWRAWKPLSITASGVRLGGNARLINKNRRESVQIGENSICKGIIRIEDRGSLSIGSEVYIGDNTIISSAESIRIGNGTLIAHNVQIFDNTSHPLDWRQREYHFRKLLGLPKQGHFDIATSPVIIGCNCWLGFGCIILKGVTVGDRAIIGAGAVVTKDVPSDTLVVSPEMRHIDLEIDQKTKGGL